MCLYSIVLLPNVFDFLPRKSVKKGLNIMSACLSKHFSCVHSLKMQIKIASLEGRVLIQYPRQPVSFFLFTLFF